jgi:MarR family transcriptional regulator, lower aerobic nicotinate degradation pathway regulator
MNHPDAGTPVSQAACRAAAHLGRTVDRVLSDAPLSPAGYRVLSWLSMGSSAAAVLAEKLAVSRPTVTLVVDGLQARGLVERTADDNDRRRVTISMTPAGEAALATADAMVASRLEEILGPLGPDTAAGIVTALERLQGALRDDRERRHRRTTPLSTG